ncbi:MAG: restriction endonuclease subunit S [Chitinophagales bacterium]
MSKSLSELAHIFSGTDYKKNPPGDNIPIYGTGGIMGYTSVPLYKGPAVLSGRKGSINNPMYIEGEFWNVDTIFCIKTNDGVDTKWLYYNFLNTDLSLLNEATGVPSVNSKSLYKLKFKWFEYPEQRKIASILSTSDAVIEKTQSAIAKYKAIKQGMLHDLFTRGIDIKTGKLRPKYKDAPELYKESKLGWVPKEWEVDVLDNICDVTSSKRIYMNEYIEFGIPFYRSLEIILKSKNQEIGTTLYISKEKYETIEKQFGVPKYGDILITSVGTLGISYRVSINDLFYFKDGNLIWFRDFKNEEYSRFLLHSLNDLIRLQFDKITIGTSQKAFTIDKLKKLNIYVPKENETKLICTRIEMVNNKLQTEEKYLHKLQQIKAGLMGDLLSGKKKVKV